MSENKDELRTPERAERLFRTADVAARLGVSPDFLYALVDKGRLRPVKLGRRVLRFTESDVVRLIRESRR